MRPDRRGRVHVPVVVDLTLPSLTLDGDLVAGREF